jgi:hypothetical protein
MIPDFGTLGSGGFTKKKPSPPFSVINSQVGFKSPFRAQDSVVVGGGELLLSRHSHILSSQAIRNSRRLNGDRSTTRLSEAPPEKFHIEYSAATQTGDYAS